MSATNRTKSKADRLAAQPLDFYETPSDAIASLLGVLAEELPPRKNPIIIDAGCGTGAIGLAVKKAVRCDVVGIELDKGRATESNRRGLPTVDTSFVELRMFDIDHVVGNPPYSLAVDFVYRALDLVGDGGLVCFLLRLNFLGSGRQRYDLLASHSGLYRVDVLTDRPSFCTNTRCKACGGSWQFPAGIPLSTARHPVSSCPYSGVAPGSTHYKASRTDAVDYAWVTWKKGFTGDARIRICPSRKETK